MKLRKTVRDDFIEVVSDDVAVCVQMVRAFDTLHASYYDRVAAHAEALAKEERQSQREQRASALVTELRMLNPYLLARDAR